MTDHLIHLPQNFSYVYQFDGGSNDKCVEAVLAMIGEIAYPGRWVPHTLMHNLYVQYVGPDVPSDTAGTSKTDAIAWMKSVWIGYIDLDVKRSDLLAEIEAQNLQNVPQLLTIADMKQLHDAHTGATLYKWNLGSGVGHCILRVGYSDSQSYGLYYDPAADPSFSKPVAILWSDIQRAGILTCIAAMPNGVPTPPPGFSYQHGVWPPPPPFDKAKAASTLEAAITNLQGLLTDLKA